MTWVTCFIRVRLWLIVIRVEDCSQMTSIDTIWCEQSCPNPPVEICQTSYNRLNMKQIIKQEKLHCHLLCPVITHFVLAQERMNFISTGVKSISTPNKTRGNTFILALIWFFSFYCKKRQSRQKRHHKKNKITERLRVWPENKVRLVGLILVHVCLCVCVCVDFQTRKTSIQMGIMG